MKYWVIYWSWADRQLEVTSAFDSYKYAKDVAENLAKQKHVDPKRVHIVREELILKPQEVKDGKESKT